MTRRKEKNILGLVTQVRTWKCERQWYSWKQVEGGEALKLPVTHFILPARILKKKHGKIATRASKSVHDKDHKLQLSDNSKSLENFKKKKPNIFRAIFW